MKDFANEDNVVFGDVVLREDRITQGPLGGALNPGKGGWPTVRYFNTQTGYDGAPYEKKSSDPMCTVRWLSIRVRACVRACARVRVGACVLL